MHQYRVKFSALTLTAATVKTLAMVTAPSTRRVRLIEACISFASVTTSDVPALVELFRASTAGTPGSSYTPTIDDPADPAALSSGGINFSAEPTATDIVAAWNVPVQGGLLSYQLPLGSEIVIPASGRLALRGTAAQTQTSNVSGYLVFVE